MNTRLVALIALLSLIGTASARHPEESRCIENLGSYLLLNMPYEELFDTAYDTDAYTLLGRPAAPFATGILKGTADQVIKLTEKKAGKFVKVGQYQRLYETGFHFADSSIFPFAHYQKGTPVQAGFLMVQRGKPATSCEIRYDLAKN